MLISNQYSRVVAIEAILLLQLVIAKGAKLSNTIKLSYTIKVYIKLTLEILDFI